MGDILFLFARLVKPTLHLAQLCAALADLLLEGLRPTLLQTQLLQLCVVVFILAAFCLQVLLERFDDLL